MEDDGGPVLSGGLFIYRSLDLHRSIVDNGHGQEAKPFDRVICKRGFVSI